MNCSLNCVCAVLLITYCFDLVLCIVPSNSAENAVHSNGIHQNQEKFTPLWFSSRIGRRRLNDRSKLSDLLESLEEYPWTLIAVSDNTGASDAEKRGNTHNFTPRLGRNLEETHTTDDLMDLSERSVSFSPRLGRGRHFSPYSPRLGRDDSMAYV